MEPTVNKECFRQNDLLTSYFIYLMEPCADIYVEKGFGCLFGISVAFFKRANIKTRQSRAPKFTKALI